MNSINHTQMNTPQMGVSGAPQRSLSQTDQTTQNVAGQALNGPVIPPSFNFTPLLASILASLPPPEQAAAAKVNTAATSLLQPSQPSPQDSSASLPPADTDYDLPSLSGTLGPSKGYTPAPSSQASSQSYTPAPQAAVEGATYVAIPAPPANASASAGPPTSAPASALKYTSIPPETSAPAKPPQSSKTPVLIGVIKNQISNINKLKQEAHTGPLKQTAAKNWREAQNILAKTIASQISVRTTKMQNAYMSNQMKVVDKYQNEINQLLKYAGEGAVAGSKRINGAIAEFKTAKADGAAVNFRNRLATANFDFQRAITHSASKGVPVPADAFVNYARQLAKLESQADQLPTDRRVPDPEVVKTALSNSALKPEEKTIGNEQAQAKASIREARALINEQMKARFEVLENQLKDTEYNSDGSWSTNVASLLNSNDRLKQIEEAGKFKLDPSLYKASNKFAALVDASAQRRVIQARPKLADRPTEDINGNLARLQKELGLIKNPSRMVQQLTKAVNTDLRAIKENEWNS